jgi:hypothetical protein
MGKHREMQCSSRCGEDVLRRAIDPADPAGMCLRLRQLVQLSEPDALVAAAG